MDEKEADKLINEILHLFEDTDIEIMVKLTLFAKVQNLVYQYVKK